ncbi:MAG: hypothetical protein HZB31_04315 [Nitrospirae bacterium]|nr:hypothetical protein [Nitrospirota bacterium]
MKVKDILLSVSISVLLFIVIATSEFRFEYMYLFFIGVVLNALPVLIGKVIATPKITENLFIAGTYGGGNRGVFLVSFFMPNKLLEFMIIDLGNYISLLLIYPMLFRRKHLEKKNLLLVSLTIIAVIGGIYINKNQLPCYWCSEVKSGILYAIVIYTIIQIIQWLKENRPRVLLDADFAWFISARIGIVGLLLLLYYFVTASWIPTLLIFTVLPTSSLLFVFFNRQDQIYDRVVKNTIASMLVYFAAIISFFIVKNIPQYM